MEIAEINYPTKEEVINACERRLFTLDNPGFCIFCGEEQEGHELGAMEDHCESCGRPGVFGAEELLIRGWVK